jgi:hypothetical protein
LAELDFQQAEKVGEDKGEEEDEVENELPMRNYRREIYQISIYGSRILLSQLDGKWVNIFETKKIDHIFKSRI